MRRAAASHSLVDMADAARIPMRRFGRSDAQISALGMGGHHLGDAESYAVAERLVRDALEGGITFFDNCWEYHNGKSEDWLGRALRGQRDRAFLMTKVCTHGRGKALALQMLDQSLRRLQTDHLDLWQLHGMTFEQDPERAFMKGGAVEALEEAKKAGKVRFVGFSGHKSPDIHFAMLQYGFAWDAVQMPLNAFDASFKSFEKKVLPELLKQGIAPLGMKSMNGHADAIKAGVISAEEALRYAMSLPVATTICGMEKPEVLQKNLQLAQSFQPLDAAAMQALRDKVKEAAGDGRYELYKMSLKFDNPEARRAHGFLVDSKQLEIKEETEEAQGKEIHN